MGGLLDLGLVFYESGEKIFPSNFPPENIRSDLVGASQRQISSTENGFCKKNEGIDPFGAPGGPINHYRASAGDEGLSRQG